MRSKVKIWLERLALIALTKSSSEKSRHEKGQCSRKFANAWRCSPMWGNVLEQIMKLKISKAFEKRSLTFSNRDEPKINLNCNVGKCVTRCFHFKVQKRDLLEKLFFRYKKRDSKNFFTGFNGLEIRDVVG